MEQGRPFVGPSGARLAEWWAEVGLSRDDFYITNVLDYQPRNIDAVPRDEMERAFATLHERLAGTSGVICPTGNYALYACTGKGRVSWHQRDGRTARPGITKWRGSILSYIDHGGRTRKVVPTIHPAATFARGGKPKPKGKSESIQTGEQAHWVSREWDWPRVAYESTFPEIDLPQREHITAPTLGEVEEFCNQIRAGQVIAVDVETPRPTKKSRAYLGCVGIAVSSVLSLTIPTTRTYWQQESTRSRIVQLLAKVLTRSTVVMHNGMFDAFWLRHEGMPVRHFVWDTRALHATLWPRLPHDLAFVGTTLTRQPYWKDECKDPDELMRFAKNDEALWHYNGIDCCVTFEVAERLIAKLEAAGMLETYKRRVARMTGPLLEMTFHGIAYDSFRATQHDARAREEQEAAKAGAGPIFAKKGLSNHAIRYALYGAKGLPEKNREATVAKLEAKGVVPLNLPVQYKRGKGGKRGPVTCDEHAVRNLALRFPERAGALCEAVMAFQRASSLRKQLADGKVDADGRMRCLFNFVSTRLSAAKNPLGTGDNLQNRDKELRDIFVPDPGCVFLRLDMSQIESRIIFMLTRDKALVEMARTPPYELDVHTENAKLIFSTPTPTDEQRKLGKTVSYLAQRGGQAKKLQEVLLLQGLVKSEAECQRWMEAYHRKHPALQKYFKDIRIEMMRHRALASTWGDIITFPYARLEEDVYGTGYSWLPQREAGGIIDNYGVQAWQKLSRDRAAFYAQAHLHLQVHDELLFSVHPVLAWELARAMAEQLERPRVYFGEAMTVPVTFGLGRSWKIEREWKRLPPREEFTLGAL